MVEEKDENMKGPYLLPVEPQGLGQLQEDGHTVCRTQLDLFVLGFGRRSCSADPWEAHGHLQSLNGFGQLTRFPLCLSADQVVQRMFSDLEWTDVKHLRSTTSPPAGCVTNCLSSVPQSCG